MDYICKWIVSYTHKQTLKQNHLFANMIVIFPIIILLSKTSSQFPRMTLAHEFKMWGALQSLQCDRKNLKLFFHMKYLVMLNCYITRVYNFISD